MCLIAAPLFSVDNPFALPLGTIVIDAGHGGHDPGAIRSFEGSLIVERELTLDIALRLVLPPKTSALLLSIHINSAEHPAAQGFEVFTKLKEKEVPILDSKTPKEHIALFSKHNKKELNILLFEETRKVATVVSSALVKGLPMQVNRGIKELDLWVLNAARMPAVLVEAGFLSNDKELALLLDPQYRQTIALALFHAIEALLST